MGIETFFKKAAITDVDKVQTPGTTRTISVQGPQDVDLMPNTQVKQVNLHTIM